MKKIAIIGAGLAGLSLARQLTPHAHVEIFEKSRGVSGRMSTRRAEQFHFDHGAQFFTASTPEFKSFLQPLLSASVVARWDANFAEFDNNKIVKTRKWDAEFPHYVGTPAMNAINKHLAQDLPININTLITRLEKLTAASTQWQLHDDEGNTYGEFDWVISTAPAQQTVDLMPKNFSHYQSVADTTMQACFSLMLGFDKPLALDFDAALVRNSDISWISVNSNKPNRPSGYTLLVNSTNEWANEHIDDDRNDVMDYLCQQTEHVIGHNLNSATHKGLHGWRYANIPTQSEKPVLIDTDNQLAVCGDWCIKGKVEAAFTSSHELGNVLIEKLNN